MQTSVATYNTTISALFYGENFCGERQLSWDEENRLRSICDNGYVSSYFYDAAGERTVKLHGSGEGIHVNSAFSGGYTNNVDYTLYVDAYMVLEKGGQYTKHIYIGDQRIVSKLGDVGSFGVDPRREQYAGEDVAGVEVPNYKTKYEALQNVIKDNYQLFEVDYYGIDNDNYVDGAGFCCEPKAQAKNARSLPTENVDYEKLQYYYHSDHLGSASYITNLDGEVVQHIEYVPFGEVFLEERNNTWNTPFLFNGKELDEETGLYYYGARYYNPRISLWYGVDPLAEKHPDKTPYHYCSNNPIMRIDPDGLTDFIVNKETGRITQVGDPNNERDRILKTNGNGEIKRYTRGEREGQAKVAIDDISTGILEDGLNLKENNGSFNVNGEEQPSLEDFNWFISKFSDYIGKEITGIRLGDENSDEVREVLTYQYRDNTRTTSRTPRSWFTIHGSRLKGHFHTHPYGDHTPSDLDRNLKREYPQLRVYTIAGGYEEEY